MVICLKKRLSPYNKKKRIEELLLESDVAINGMIELELLGGARSENEYNRLKNRLEALYYVEADRPLWYLASKIAFDLKRKGMSIPYPDIVIAASALKEGAVLIHADSHFDLIAEHTDLKVESLVSLIMQE
jgi:hypothetical protein